MKIFLTAQIQGIYQGRIKGRIPIFPVGNLTLWFIKIFYFGSMGCWLNKIENILFGPGLRHCAHWVKRSEKMISWIYKKTGTGLTGLVSVFCFLGCYAVKGFRGYLDKTESELAQNVTVTIFLQPCMNMVSNYHLTDFRTKLPAI